MFSNLFHFLVKERKNTSRRPAPVRIVIVGLLIIALITLVAACGGDTIDQTEEPEEGTSEATEPESTEEVIPTEENEPLENGEQTATPPVLLGQPLESEELQAFATLIEESQLISSEDVALTSTVGLLYEEGLTIQQETYLNPNSNRGGAILGSFSQQVEDFGFIGATTRSALPFDGTYGEIIGVLYVNESVAGGEYQAGMYQVISVTHPLAPPNDSVLLVHETEENSFFGNGFSDPLRTAFPIPGSGSAFLITMGSHRCHFCPWWLTQCICFNCPHW
jgi:hypothetical protein